MNYGQIRKYDIANGPGIRTSFFVTGCRLKCKNCFNESYQDPNFGSARSEKEDRLLIDYLKDPNVSGLSILGGEPFEHIDILTDIIINIKAKVDKPIWVYSGHTYENLVENPKAKKLLSLIDVLVDGPFIEEMKDLNLYFRGSKNQRIINTKESLNKEKVILADGYL